jgi:hypothetical protein
MSGIGNTDACLYPRHAPESGKLGTSGRLPQLLRLQLRLLTTTTANFLRLNDDIDHDNINLIDFIYDDYITNSIIDHDYSALTPGYIDIGNKGYHLNISSLCSSQTVCVTTDPTARGGAAPRGRVYVG